jgi:hypothetical protein
MFTFMMKKQHRPKRQRTSTRVYRLLNAVVAQTKNFPFGVNATTEHRNVKLRPTTPAHLLVETYSASCHYCRMYLLYLFSSIIILTPNRQFLGCATIAIIERNVVSFQSLDVVIHFTCCFAWV